MTTGTREKVNELERELHRQVQGRIVGQKKYLLLNEYKGPGYVSMKEKKKRGSLHTTSEVEMLKQLVTETIQ